MDFPQLNTFKIKLTDAKLPQDILDKVKAGTEALFIRKGYDAPSQEYEFNTDEKSRVVRVTTGTLDRDGEVVRPDGADLSHYQKNPVVLWAHDYREMPVGKAKWIKAENGAIVAKTVYNYANNARAKEIFDSAKDGFPLAVSVGFVPVEYVTQRMTGFADQLKEVIAKGWVKASDSGKVNCIYTKWIMLEYSDVPIPANPDALQLAIAKGFVKTLQDGKYAIGDTIIEKDAYIHTKPEPEETENEIRIRLRDPNDFEDGSFRQIEIKKDKPRVNAIAGRLKGEDSLTLQSYRFPKEDGWTIASAKKWADEHPVKEFADAVTKTVTADTKPEISKVFEQLKASIKTLDMQGNPCVDEIAERILDVLGFYQGVECEIEDLYPVDYPHGHVVVCMSNDDTEVLLDYKYVYDVVSKRVTLFDPIEVEERYVQRSSEQKAIKAIRHIKEGRVLSDRNIRLLREAMAALQSVIDMASKEDNAKAGIIRIVKSEPATNAITKSDVEALLTAMQGKHALQLKEIEAVKVELIEGIKRTVARATGKATID